MTRTEQLEATKRDAEAVAAFAELGLTMQTAECVDVRLCPSDPRPDSPRRVVAFAFKTKAEADKFLAAVQKVTK